MCVGREQGREHMEGDWKHQIKASYGRKWNEEQPGSKGSVTGMKVLMSLWIRCTEDTGRQDKGTELAQPLHRKQRLRPME